MTYSIYQLALFDYIQNGTGSAVISAVAGSGKTTSIVEACRRLPSTARVLFLAFNVSIVNELKGRLPKTINCSTFNSCGWRAWLGHVGGRIQVNANKTKDIIKGKFSDDDRFGYGSFVSKMVALAKSSGLKVSDSDDAWLDVADHHALMLEDETGTLSLSRGLELAKKTLDFSIRNARTVCDFDDQLYMPWLANATFDKFDVVFVDEAQDTNNIQKELLRRMLKSGGRLIAVGDENQAIYGFRGSESNSMEAIQNTFSAVRLPLSISYRCCKAVIREAQRYVSHIEAFDGAPEGQVETLENYSANTFAADDAVICRKNAPLISFAYSMIARGRGVNFMGRDLGEGLKAMVSRLNAKDIADLDIKLDNWAQKEVAKLTEKEEEDQIDLLMDKVNCIKIFIAHLPENKQTVDDLIDAIDTLFAGTGGLTLASVHRSKGREWHRVFILDFDLMPLPAAQKRDWMMVQENNLIYVAITRAKEYLGFIQTDCWSDNPNMDLPKRPAPKKSAKKAGKSSKVIGLNLFN